MGRQASSAVTVTDGETVSVLLHSISKTFNFLNVFAYLLIGLLDAEALFYFLLCLLVIVDCLHIRLCLADVPS